MQPSHGIYVTMEINREQLTTVEAMNKLINKWRKGALVACMALGMPFVMNAQTSVNQVQAAPAKASIWYFGDQAGLDFSGGAPVALTNGAMRSFEGVATMSDKNGRLLFYSNGGDFPFTGGVWNRNHQIMPNGVMTGRGGCNSSAQAALIVPQPRSSSIYYLFTTDCMENNSVGGLRYNIIDMNADGGLGDVVSANNKLLTPTDESVTAVQHANGDDYWIITHKLRTDSFYVYHLGPQGIVGVVKTKIGNVTPNYAGALKVSTNGQKLVYCGLNWTALYDFDILTGKISHYVDLNTASYSAAFSPNCRYLYTADGAGRTVSQFDMISPRPASSKIAVGTTVSNGFGGLALGPDQKIYLSRFVSSPYVAVITDPDLRGTACNYIDDGVYLNGKMCKGSLPNFPNNMLGGCSDYPVENVHDDSRTLTQITIDYWNSHHINIHWNSNGTSNVLYREAGTKTWTSIVAEANTAVLEDLKANTKYEIRVLPLTVENADYEPMADHLFADDMNKMDSEETGIATATTTSDISFDLYPNPTKGISNIALTMGDQTSDITVKVTDVQGKVVNELRYNDISGFNRYQLPTDELADGIYNVQVATSSTSATKKLVIVR